MICDIWSLLFLYEIELRVLIFLPVQRVLQFREYANYKFGPLHIEQQIRRESTRIRVQYELDFDLTIFQRSKSPRVVHFRHTEAAVIWRGFIRSRGEHQQNFFGTRVLMNLRPDHEFSRLERKR